MIKFTLIKLQQTFKKLLDGTDTIKGILHQKNVCCLNLIFWIVMGCGIAHFDWRGLKTTWTCEGTDTLSYTASALSFMLENLGKTVIVTGSQVN